MLFSSVHHYKPILLINIVLSYMACIILHELLQLYFITKYIDLTSMVQTSIDSSLHKIILGLTQQTPSIDNAYTRKNIPFWDYMKSALFHWLKFTVAILTYKYPLYEKVQCKSSSK